MSEETNVTPENAEALAVEQTPEEALKSMHLERRLENIRIKFAKGREIMNDNKRPVLNTRQIVASNPIEYTQAVEEAILDGFQVPRKGPGVPCQVGYLTMCTMVQLGDLPHELKAAEPISEEKQEFLNKFGDQKGAAVEEAVKSAPAKRGPKGKGINV